MAIKSQTALIAGVTGQDGAYQAHHLLGVGCRVMRSSRDAQMADMSRGQVIGETSRRSNGEVVVRINLRYFCPAEVESLLSDPVMARARLGCQSTTTAEELVAKMVEHDKEEPARRRCCG